jgi:cytoskeletal protein RodZ
MITCISMRWALHPPPESIVGAFGEKLRKQRERRGLELDAISNTTKISTRMLRAIEDEHFDQLPGGVFNKGFVRAYARQVGLDEEETITEYLAALRESQIHSQTILPNFRTPVQSPNEAHQLDRRNPDRNHDAHDNDLPNSHPPITNLHSSNLHGKNSAPDSPAPDRHIEDRHIEDRRIEVRRKETRRREDRETPHQETYPSADVSIPDRSHEPHPDESLDEDLPSPPLSFLNLTSAPSAEHAPHLHPEPFATSSLPEDNPSRVPWEKLVGALLLITLSLALWTLHRRHQSATAATQTQPATSNPSPAPVAALASTAADRPSPHVASPSVPPTPKASSPANSAPPDPDTDVVVRKPAAPTAAAKPPTTFTLLIRADQTSWVAITADGQPVAHETLIAPAHTSVRASHEITVRAGNSAGISFLLNGKEIPASGTPGEARTYTFDATGLKSSDSVPPANPTR